METKNMISSRELGKIYGNLLNLSKDDRENILEDGFHATYSDYTYKSNAAYRAYPLYYLTKKETGLRCLREVFKELGRLGFSPVVGSTVYTASPIGISELIQKIASGDIGTGSGDPIECWFVLPEGTPSPAMFNGYTVLALNMFTNTSKKNTVADTIWFDGDIRIKCYTEDKIDTAYAICTYAEDYSIYDCDRIIGYNMGILGGFIRGMGNDRTRKVTIKPASKRVDFQFLDSFCPTLLTENDWKSERIDDYTMEHISDYIREAVGLDGKSPVIVQMMRNGNGWAGRVVPSTLDPADAATLVNAQAVRLAELLELGKYPQIRQLSIAYNGSEGVAWGYASYRGLEDGSVAVTVY